MATLKVYLYSHFSQLLTLAPKVKSATTTLSHDKSNNFHSLHNCTKVSANPYPHPTTDTTELHQARCISTLVNPTFLNHRTYTENQAQRQA